MTSIYSMLKDCSKWLNLKNIKTDNMGENVIMDQDAKVVGYNVAHNDLNIETYNQMIQKGKQAYQENNRQEALALFKDAISLAPDQFQAYREAGNVYRALGLLSEAENFYHLALIRRPNDLASAIDQAVCIRRQGNHELCLQQLMEVAEHNLNNGHLFREIAVTLKELGRLAEAEQWFRRTLLVFPTNEFVLMQFGLLYRMLGNRELALAQFEAIIQNYPLHHQAYLEVATELKELDRLVELEEWALRVLALFPSNGFVLMQFGLLARTSGNRGLALSLFETIIQNHPLNLQAYLEVATELQALGRRNEAVQKLQIAFEKNKAFRDKYLLMLFGLDARAATHLLILYADTLPVSDAIIKHFADYTLACPQDTVDLNAFTKNQVIALLSQEHFAARVIRLRLAGWYDSFITLLSYFEPLLIALSADDHQSLMNGNLFKLMIVFAYYKKNNEVIRYVLDRVGLYIAEFPFSDLCRATHSLIGLTGSFQGGLSLFAKAATEKHSIDSLLACLIMHGYYPEEPCLAAFADKETLLKLLPFFGVPNNTATLKNIFTHLLQKELLTVEDVKALYPDPEFLGSIKAINEALKPIFQTNSLPPRLGKPEKLKVAVCISGQLRGYKDAFVSIKKTIIDPLQPDIFVHTWQDVGFKDPFPSRAVSSRVFQGHFLQAYLDLASLNNYSFQNIKEMLPTIFSLLNKNGSVTQEQLTDYYGADFVVVEDDKADPYVALSNQQKMFYKIEACNQLVQASGKSYDLVIRLRPDKELYALEHTDWRQIAEICNHKKFIFTTCFAGLRNFLEVGRYHLGDIVAIGSQKSMNFYAGVPKFQEFFADQGLAHFEKVGQSSQSILGHGLWLGGYATKDVPLKLGNFINTQLKAEDILQAINQDLANLDSDVAESLVKALEQDILDQKQF